MSGTRRTSRATSRTRCGTSRVHRGRAPVPGQPGRRGGLLRAAPLDPDPRRGDLAGRNIAGLPQAVPPPRADPLRPPRPEPHRRRQRSTTRAGVRATPGRAPRFAYGCRRTYAARASRSSPPGRGVGGGAYNARQRPRSGSPVRVGASRPGTTPTPSRRRGCPVGGYEEATAARRRHWASCGRSRCGLRPGSGSVAIERAEKANRCQEREPI